MSAEWKLWQLALTKGFHLRHGQKLVIPLGKWLSMADLENKWFTDGTGLELYQKINGKWFSFTPILARHRLCSFHALPNPMLQGQPPTNIMRASVYKQGTIITVTGRGPITSNKVEEESNQLASNRHRWQLYHLQTEGSVAEVIQALRKGNAVAVSDGSFKDYAGAAAWTIEGDTAANRVVSTGLTLGKAEDQSAYQSELFGLWGILASLKQLVEDYRISHGHVTIACDGLSALKKAQSNYPTDPGEAHHDLISAIKNLRATLTLTISFIHVKGHQDQGIITALPRLAWMNIEMDALAKQTLSQAA